MSQDTALRDAIERLHASKGESIELPSGHVLLRCEWTSSSEEPDKPASVAFSYSGHALLCLGAVTFAKLGQYEMQIYGAQPVGFEYRDSTFWKPIADMAYMPMEPFLFSTMLPAMVDVRRGPGHAGDAPAFEVVLVCQKSPMMTSLDQPRPEFSISEYVGTIPKRHEIAVSKALPIDITISGTWMPVPGKPRPFAVAVSPAEGDDTIYEAIDFFAFNGEGQFWLVDVHNRVENSKVFEGKLDVTKFAPMHDEERPSTFRMGRFSREHPLILAFEGKLASATQPQPRLLAVLRAIPVGA